MQCRPFLTLAASTLLVAGCAVAPRGELTPAAESVRVVAEKPQGNFEDLGRVTGYGGPGCDNPSTFEDSRRRAWISLRNKAAAEGATVVRVVGAGELESRGGCMRDQYQVTGIALRPGTETSAPEPASTAGDPAPAAPTAAPESRSTADQLSELIELRERGLISEQEYQNLRDQVLENAFGS